jgi:type VI protein secretion system component Hcp
MFTMMESLEGRQMFSVASPELTTLAAPDAAVDTTPTIEKAAPKSSPKLFAVCATGKHIPVAILTS